MQSKDFKESLREKTLLMEGAIAERLKHEFGFSNDPVLALAPFVYDDEKRTAINSLWQQYIDIAQNSNLPFMATTPTRRVNVDSIKQSTYDKSIIKDNVDNLKELKTESMFVGGLMGCKGDAYKCTEVLSVKEAKEFHSWAASLFKEAGVDFLFAGIMPAITEAIGMAQAMEQTGLPYIISFMTRDNGKLIDGTTIHDAIYKIDSMTDRTPICYMANCIHPTVLYKALSKDFNNTGLVKDRFKGIQANTSALSPEELDGCEVLKCSDSISLANDIGKLRSLIDLKIIGGCCGTNNSYIREISKLIQQGETL